MGTCTNLIISGHSAIPGVDNGYGTKELQRNEREMELMKEIALFERSEVETLTTVE